MYRIDTCGQIIVYKKYTLRYLTVEMHKIVYTFVLKLFIIDSVVLSRKPEASMVSRRVNILWSCYER